MKIGSSILRDHPRPSFHVITYDQIEKLKFMIRLEGGTNEFKR